MSEEENIRHVTAENIDEVAEWCHGRVVGGQTYSSSMMGSKDRVYISIDRDSIAQLGDYIVQLGDDFEVFTAEHYNLVPEAARREPDKYQAILKLVTIAMTEQFAAAVYHNEKDMRKIAKDTALQILALG